MTKILIKKQLMEVFAWIFQNKKTGKNRDKKGIITYVAIYIAIFGMLGFVFYEVAGAMCPALVQLGYSWLYMLLMSIIGISLGVFGSVFNTFASLYQAKDNDLLLSMPIPNKSILIARLSGVYAMGLMYELIVMIPTVIVYFINVKITFTIAVFSILIPIILSILILTLSCILGWIVAQINSKLKNQKILTVIVSIAFIALYYYVCGKAGNIFAVIITHPENIASKVKGVLYPLYQMGLAAEGKAVSMAIFSGIILAIFALVYIVLERSFLKLATTNKGATKVKYVEKQIKTASVEKALCRKEFKRFLESPTYMLNCGLGILFMIFLAVVLIVKMQDIREVLDMIPQYKSIVSMGTIAVICMTASMNTMSAPSISLEGKNIWILQSLPVTGWQALKAKFSLQFILTAIPAIFMTICLEIVIKPTIYFAIIIPVTVIAFIVLMDILGLVCNLKTPNLKWTNEMIPIKQSLSVFIDMIGGWVIIMGSGVGYYFLRDIVSAETYIIILLAIIILANRILIHWLKTKGSQIFEKL